LEILEQTLINSISKKHLYISFFISIAGISKAGMSGKMVSGALVQKTGREGRAGRGGLA
jgi:hypothetical protein